MRTFVVLAVSIVLVSILFCSMAMAAPTMPADLQMVQPDPSLPKELAGFWGKWDEGTYMFLIVEKIDEEKASVYVWRSGLWPPQVLLGWTRYEAKVIKEYGKNKLWYRTSFGNGELTLKGEYLIGSSPLGISRFRRVP